MNGSGSSFEVPYSLVLQPLRYRLSFVGGEFHRSACSVLPGRSSCFRGVGCLVSTMVSKWIRKLGSPCRPLLIGHSNSILTSCQRNRPKRGAPPSPHPAARWTRKSWTIHGTPFGQGLHGLGRPSWARRALPRRLRIPQRRKVHLDPRTVQRVLSPGGRRYREFYHSFG